MRLKAQSYIFELPLEAVHCVGIVHSLEFFGHPNFAYEEVGLDGFKNFEDARDIIDEGDIDSFDLRPKGKAAVGDHQSVGVPNAAQ